MDYYEVIQKRHSIRGYFSDPVPQDKLDRILQAACTAPSATNAQPIQLIVIKDMKTREVLKAVYERDWFISAPVIIVGCVDPAKAWKRSDGFNAAELDLAIALDHLILAATSEGLGTCWVCNFNEAKVKQILGIPDGIRVIAMTPLGFQDPSVPLRASVRKGISELIRFEKWL